MELRRNNGKTNMKKLGHIYYLKPDSKALNKLIPHPENRDINPANVRSLKKALLMDPMSGRNWTPIQVNIRTRHVLDGNHRIEMLKHLPDSVKNNVSLPMYYVDMPESEELDHIVKVNNGQRHWMNNDWLKRNKDVPEMKALHEFCSRRRWLQKITKRTTSPNAGYGAAFFWGKSLTSNQTKKGNFSGPWSLQYVDMDKAEKLYGIAEGIADTMKQNDPSLTNGPWFQRLGQALYAVDRTPCLSPLLWANQNKLITAVAASATAGNTSKNNWFNCIATILQGYATPAASVAPAV